MDCAARANERIVEVWIKAGRLAGRAFEDNTGMSVDWDRRPVSQTGCEERLRHRLSHKRRDSVQAC